MESFDDWTFLRPGRVLVGCGAQAPGGLFKLVGGPRERVFEFPVVPGYNGPRQYRARVWEFETDLPGPYGGGGRSDVWQEWKFGSGLDERDRDSDGDHELSLPVQMGDVEPDFSRGTLKEGRSFKIEVPTDARFAMGHALRVDVTKDVVPYSERKDSPSLFERHERKVTESFASVQQAAACLDFGREVFDVRGLASSLDASSVTCPYDELNVWRHAKLHDHWHLPCVWERNQVGGGPDPERAAKEMALAFQTGGPADEIWVRCSDGWWVYMAEKGLQPGWGFHYQAGHREVPAGMEACIRPEEPRVPEPMCEGGSDSPTACTEPEPVTLSEWASSS